MERARTRRPGSGGADDQPATLINAADSAMYQAKRDQTSGDRDGRPSLVFPPDVWRPKLERLTNRLLDLLAGLEGAVPPVATEEHDPTDRAVA